MKYINQNFNGTNSSLRQLASLKTIIIASYFNENHGTVMNCAEKRNEHYYDYNAKMIQKKVETEYIKNACIQPVYLKQNGDFKGWREAVCSVYPNNKKCYQNCGFNQTLIDILQKGCSEDAEGF